MLNVLNILVLVFGFSQLCLNVSAAKLFAPILILFKKPEKTWVHVKRHLNGQNGNCNSCFTDDCLKTIG